MAGNKNAVRVKPNVINSQAMKLFLAAPLEGAKRPPEMTINTNNNDKVKVQVNFKRTQSGDTSELEFEYADFVLLLMAMEDLSNSPDEDIPAMDITGLSHYAGGQWSATPNPAGKLYFGRNKGVFWLSLVVGTGKPVVQFPLLETAYMKLCTKDGEAFDRSKVSKWSIRSFVKRMTGHLCQAVADRHIPWQHKEMIKEGKATPYSDPDKNFAYVSTFNPNKGNGATGGGAPAPAPAFDMDIPF